MEWLRHSGDCQIQSGDSQGLSGDGWILSGDCQTVWRLSDSLETARDYPEAGINPVDTARDCQRLAGDTMESDRCSLDTAMSQIPSEDCQKLS